MVPAATLRNASLRERVGARAKHPAALVAIALVALGALLYLLAPIRTRRQSAPTFSPPGLGADFAQHDVQPH